MTATEHAVFAAGMLVLFIATLTVGLFIGRDSAPDRFSPPCGYGAVESMAREQNGRARVVCACPVSK